MLPSLESLVFAYISKLSIGKEANRLKVAKGGSGLGIGLGWLRLQSKDSTALNLKE